MRDIQYVIQIFDGRYVRVSGRPSPDIADARLFKHRTAAERQSNRRPNSKVVPVQLVPQ
jgi:hypothetical protein